MQLLFKRSLRPSRMNATRLYFVLWAKFELDEDELRLVHKFRASEAFLTIEQSRRDLYRALFFAFFVGAFSSGFFMSRANVGIVGGVVIFLVAFGLSTWVIFEQIREAIRISDLLNGRNFKNRSLALLALLVRRERRMVGYAAAFIQFLEALRTWEGTEVIQIGPEHEPALRLVTDTYAPT